MFQTGEIKYELTWFEVVSICNTVGFMQLLGGLLRWTTDICLIYDFYV